MTSNDSDAKVRNPVWFITAALVVLCLLIFGQTLQFSFINLDDNLYVYENPIVLSGPHLDSLRWALTAFHSANWHPLTWISHMIDARLFGSNSGSHHVVNVIFHTANSVLAFAAFKRLTGDVWKSAIIAFLFAVHPAHVESVAWVAERKDVLSTMFWLLTLIAYERYARSASKEGSPTSAFLTSPYLLVVLCLALGLTAKPMLVTLPFVLLLLDYWPLGRLNSISDLKRLFIEKLPLFALSIASCVVTILAQRASGALESFETLSLLSRVSNALLSYVKYIGMMFFPSGLGILYPYREIGIGTAIAALLALLAISAVCIWAGRSRRYLIFGWLWFIGTLVPVIGLVQVGGQSMADRYTYVPYFGLFVIVVWGGAELFQRFGLDRRMQIGIAALAIAALSAAAYAQTRYWRDSETLYVHTLNVTGDNYLIEHNLCYVYVFSNRLAEARLQCERSIASNPNYVDGHNTLGLLQLRENNLAESEQTFRETISRWPRYVPAYGNLATVLIIEKRPEDAERVLEVATRVGEGVIERTQWVGHARDLAALYAEQNKYDKAAENYSRAIYLAPNRADLRFGAASALYRTGKFDPALQQLQAAISLDSNNAEFFNLAGMIFAAKGNAADATTMFEKALAIKPGFTEAQANLSKLKEATNK